jgi:hypothetical protein
MEHCDQGDHFPKTASLATAIVTELSFSNPFFRFTTNVKALPLGRLNETETNNRTTKTFGMTLFSSTLKEMPSFS